MTTITQRVNAEHPYQAVGIVLLILALILVAFDLGVLARCGQGEGLCFDTSTHGTSDAALVGFFVLLVIGVALIMYTEASSSVSTTRDSPPNVTVVNPAPTPTPTMVTVNTPPPSTPSTTVTVSPPRSESPATHPGGAPTPHRDGPASRATPSNPTFRRISAPGDAHSVSEASGRDPFSGRPTARTCRLIRWTNVDPPHGPG
jgi:hypothetical protein